MTRISVTYKNPKHDGMLSLPISVARNVLVKTGTHLMELSEWEIIKNYYYVKRDLIDKNYLTADETVTQASLTNVGINENSSLTEVLSYVRDTSDETLLRTMRDKEYSGQSRKEVLEAINIQLQILDDTNRDPEADRVFDGSVIDLNDNAYTLDEKINKINDRDYLIRLHKEEGNGANRKTVKKYIEKRLGELGK